MSKGIQKHNIQNDTYCRRHMAVDNKDQTIIQNCLLIYMMEFIKQLKSKSLEYVKLAKTSVCCIFLLKPKLVNNGPTDLYQVTRLLL